MCDCIKEIKLRMAVKLPKIEEYKGMIIRDIECHGEAFITDTDPIYECLSIPFTVYHEPIGRRKKTDMNMVAKYCPFCGKPYQPQNEDLRESMED